MQAFLENVLRYMRYFVTIILGIFFFAFEWMTPLLKRPTTAIALIGILIGGFFFIFFTLRAMLGFSPI